MVGDFAVQGEFAWSHNDRTAAKFAQAIGADVGPAGKSRVGRCPQGREGTTFRRLGEGEITQHQERLREQPEQAGIQVVAGTGQVRVRHPGMRGHAFHLKTRLGDQGLEVHGENQVGEFRLAIGGPAAVALRALEVIKVQISEPGGDGTDRYDPGFRLSLQRVEETTGQSEMPQMIGAELEFEALFGPELRWRHHTGIVDQQIEAFGQIRIKRFGKFPDRIERGEIKVANLDPGVLAGGAKPGPDLPHRFIALLLIAAGEDHPGAMPRQFTAGCQADAAVASGHDRAAATLIRHVICCPTLAHGREAIRSRNRPFTLPQVESLLAEYVADRSREAEPPPGAFTGAAGGAACGDLARISLTTSGGRIESAVFATEGCAATRAACACVCEIVEGETVLAAARIGTSQIEAELGGLSPARRHAAMLTADALHRALSAIASSTESIAPPVDGRVLVAVSGGVDSAVAALRERERGADVVAVTVKLWADPDTDGTKACCSPEAVLGARSLTHDLGIPHFTLDLEGQFRERVVGEFLRGYSEGRTPNPCVLCNGEVRIAAMVDLADRMGAECLVTGHYARVVEDEGSALIAAGSDEAKDQSYMLAALPPEVVERLRFPLADLAKAEVREIAERGGLSVAKKPESQDLCFLAGQSKKDFLLRHGGLDDRPGPVIDTEGRKLGEHPGHHHFTVGQRRGLGVAATEPLYVIGTDAETNTVKVGSRTRLSTDRVRLRDAVMHRDGRRVDRIRLRYHTNPVRARVAAAAGRHDRLEVQLDRPFDGPAPGQAAVLMSGDVVVGHATIASQRGSK